MSKFNTESRSDSPVSCNGMEVITEEVITNGNGVKQVPITRSNKAKRIRFYHNGNQHFSGVLVPVSSQRYRSFDALKTELTNIFTKRVTMPTGVQNVYTTTGCMIFEITELDEGKEYVCCGKGESFKKINYGKPQIYRNRRASNPEVSIPDRSSTRISIKDDIRPRFITVVRSGAKPRKVFRVLLNKRNAANMDQFLKVLTETARLDTGAVRKVFMGFGRPVTSLSQVFTYDSDDIYFVYGTEKCLQDDFSLTIDEIGTVRAFKKRTITTY